MTLSDHQYCLLRMRVVPGLRQRGSMVFDMLRFVHVKQQVLLHFLCAEKQQQQQPRQWQQQYAQLFKNQWRVYALTTAKS